MIRVAAMISVSIVLFCATLLGVAYMSGQITPADLRGLFGDTPEPLQDALAPRDDLSPMARMLQDRQKLLDEREAQIVERERRITQQEADLRNLKEQIESLQTSVVAALDAADATLESEIEEVANSLSSMEAERAAETLASLLRSEPAVAVKIVQLIPARQRGKILNEMTAEDSAILFQTTLEPAY